MWPDDGAKRCGRSEILRLSRDVRVHGDLPREQHSNETLRRIEQKGCRAQAFAAGADHIGSADIAAALLADVLLAEDAHQDEAEGNGAQQIRENADDEVEQHGTASSVAPAVRRNQYAGRYNRARLAAPARC